MNLALEQTEEYVDGELTNKYGDAFIRGNNGSSLGEHVAGRARACVRSRAPPVCCTRAPVTYISMQRRPR